MVLIYSVDATPLQPSVGLCADVVHFTLHLIYGFLFQNPAQSPIPFYQPLSRVLDYVAHVFVSYAANDVCADAGCLISFSIFSGS